MKASLLLSCLILTSCADTVFSYRVELGYGKASVGVEATPIFRRSLGKAPVLPDPGK